MSPELTYVNQAAEILKHRGKVFIGYITSGLEPFSAQQKPDLSYVPDHGPNAGRVYFVEVRLFEDGHFPPGFPNTIRDHKAFAEEGAECEFGGYAFGTNAEIDRASARQLSESGVFLLGPITDGDRLAKSISEWVSSST